MEYPRPTTPAEALLAQQNQFLFQENQIKTQNEQSLYNAWQIEKNSRIGLEQTVRNLQQQMQEMQTAINRMANSQIKSPASDEQTKSQETQYFTDEEELIKETEWVTKEKRKNKKRRMNSSPETSPQPQQQQQQNRQLQNKTSTKIPKVPPIVLSRIQDYDILQNQLKAYKFTFKAVNMNNEQIKLNVDSEEEYRKLTEFLNQEKFLWHSYENKQTRNIKVMARKLHPSCAPQNIIIDLQSQGYEIIDAINIRKRKEKTPLPLFMLTFRNEENINHIFEIKEILGMKVEIEPLRKSNLVSQCKRCQSFGHTQGYCNREPRCVKCAGKHHTTICNMNKEAKPKCANCGEAHPASYRGCEIAKRLQKTRNEANKNKQIKTNERKIENKPPCRWDPKAFPALPKTEANAGNPQREEVTTNQLLQSLMSKLDQQEKKFEQQEKMLKKISERLVKLEGNSNKAAASKKNK